MMVEWLKQVCFTHAAVKIKKTLRNQTVTETQDAVFSLELTHSDVKSTQWIRNGLELENSDKFQITQEGTVHTLRVKACSTQDESVYSFKLGKLTANARLNVESESTHQLFKSLHGIPKALHRFLHLLYL